MTGLLKNTSIYTIGNVLPKAAGFILLPMYTRYLTPAEFGLVTSMHALLSVAAIFFTFCLESSIIRLYWDYKSNQEKKEFLSTINISIIGSSFIVLCLLFVFKDLVSLIYSSIPFYPYYFLTFLIGFFSAFIITPKIYLRLREKAGKYLLLSVSQFLLSSAFIIWFIIFKEDGAAGYLKGQLVCSFCLLPVFCYYVFKVTGITFRVSMLKQSLSYSVPIIPAMLSAWVLNLSDRIFIERYISLTEVGIYSISYKIAGIVLIFASAFNMAYAPTFFSIANSEDQIDAKSRLFRYNNMYLFISIVACFLISFFSKEVITILFDAKYAKASYLVPLIALSYLISQFDGILGYYFKQSKRMKENAVKSLLIAVINIVLNFALIPRFGAFGAAYATILTTLILTTASYFYTKKYCYFVSFDWLRILIPTTVFFILVFLQYVLVLDVVVSLIVKIIIVGIGGLFFMRRYYPQIKVIMAK